jgi:hypothetical protein
MPFRFRYVTLPANPTLAQLDDAMLDLRRRRKGNGVPHRAGLDPGRDGCCARAAHRADVSGRHRGAPPDVTTVRIVQALDVIACAFVLVLSPAFLR